MFDKTDCLGVKYETVLFAIDFYAPLLKGSLVNSRKRVVA